MVRPLPWLSFLLAVRDISGLLLPRRETLVTEHRISFERYKLNMIRYSYEMDGPKGATRVTVELERPDWWADATARERAPLEAKALDSDDVQCAIGAGYRISNVVRPVCACVVQAVEQRDPHWAGANGSCRRCGGPLKKKGKRRNG